MQTVTVDIDRAPWRKLPPVNIDAIVMTIGRNHLPILGLKSNQEFMLEHFALARQLLTFKHD